jgi:cation:H+ antiporter
MLLTVVAIIVGLVLLVWSADIFIDGTAITAQHIGAPPLLIGIVIVGFGTSAPEMVVSVFSALQGNPGIAIGNAYGSNIANIAFVLGITALVSPVFINSQVLRKELPILCMATLFGALLVWDGLLTRQESSALLMVLGGLLGWSIWQGLRVKDDSFGNDVVEELAAHDMPLEKAIIKIVLGLLVLVGSSKLLVWGAVEIAMAFGISEVIIGLTVIALGTSLPELAASISALRKGEHDLIIGNVLGSNLFNTLGVVGIAGIIRPIVLDPEVLNRDYLVMGTLTAMLFVFGYRFKMEARINRYEGGFLFLCYLCYMGWLASTVLYKGNM